MLYKDGEPAGFFELDARYGTSVNLSYFGLMPHVIGTGTGPGFLRQAIDAAWRNGPTHGHGQHMHRRSSAGVAELSARGI